MALRNIFMEGDPVLRQRAKEVTVFDRRLGILLDDMLETMRKGGGVGLAGPQVGILKRVAVIEYAGETWELVNPKIVSSSGSVIGMEGCLSVDPRKDGKVARPQEVTVVYQDRNGNRKERKVEDWMARIVCHETDHLNGILFIDKVMKEENQNQGV
ncbi:MAG: peptide deformylase [Clostridia bacterium]|nr:peptide deformylase [Clostridia bacterium]